MVGPYFPGISYMRLFLVSEIFPLSEEFDIQRTVRRDVFL